MYEEEKLTEGLVLARTRAVDLSGVKKLNFWGSDITDISVVRNMPNLEVCSVSVNNISTLADFANCKNLTELYIRKNKIENLAEIFYLKNLPRLRNLWLADNPCAEVDNYRATVLRTLPNLQKLDNVVVTEEEMSESQEKGDVLSPPPDAEITENPESPENEEDQKTRDQDKNEDITENNSEKISENGNLDKSSKEHNEKKGPDKESKSSEVKPAANNSKKSLLDPVTLSWEETNKIREELGLKPLPFEKITTPKPVARTIEKSRNAHVLQAVLILIRELDTDSLEIVESAVHKILHPET